MVTRVLAKNVSQKAKRQVKKCGTQCAKKCHRRRGG